MADSSPAPLAALRTMTEQELMLVTLSPESMTEEEAMLVAEIAALRAALAERERERLPYVRGRIGMVFGPGQRMTLRETWLCSDCGLEHGRPHRDGCKYETLDDAEWREFDKAMREASVQAARRSALDAITASLTDDAIRGLITMCRSQPQMFSREDEQGRVQYLTKAEAVRSFILDALADCRDAAPSVGDAKEPA